MLSFLARRIVLAIPTLIGVLVVVFLLLYVAPGDPVQEMVGERADPETIARLRKELRLDDPLPVQYGRFLKGIVAGADYSFGPEKARCPAPCFGYSFRNNQPVWDLLLDRLPVTVSLASGAAVLWLVLGVSIGVLSALRRGTAFDKGAMTFALAGVSLPVYFTGLISLSLFAYTWHLWPNGVNYVSFTTNPLDWAYNLVLPWVTLAFLYAALYARLTRAGMLETMNEDYIRTARAKGLPERTVVTKHAMRATLTPILTIFGLDLGLLLGGAVLTESTFSLPGLGQLVVDAVFGNDLPIVLGVVMVAGFFVVLANLVVDVLYAVLDPRVRT